MLLLSPQMTSCGNEYYISSLPTRNVILISTASTATFMATALHPPASNPTLLSGLVHTTADTAMATGTG